MSFFFSRFGGREGNTFSLTHGLSSNGHGLSNHRSKPGNRSSLPERITTRIKGFKRRIAMNRRLVIVVLTVLLVYSLYSRRSGKLRSSQRRDMSNYSVGPSRISTTPLPVHHDENLIDYANTPISVHRPNMNQFSLSATLPVTEPVVCIITATQNPREVMLESFRSIRHQSLQNWEWVIVDDHSTDPDSLELLQEIAKDPRVTLLVNSGMGGLAATRNVGFEYALSKPVVPPYFSCLDDDDLYELTALEKAVWMIESNSKEWDMVGFPFVKWSSQNTTEWRGMHSGIDNYNVGNFVANTAVFKAAVLIESGCRYNTDNYDSGGEDWDLWMCFAGAGFWGGQLPELLYWYRVNPSTFRQTRWGSTFVDGFNVLHAKIKAAHPTIATTPFPIVQPRESNQLEPMVWDMPFQSRLSTEGKSIMFIVPWLYVGGADIGAMRMIQLYVEAGYRVTVVCTLYKNPEGLELRPYILQLTHDVHTLPAFLRMNDFPRYIKYLVESRGIKEVIMSNTQYTYEALPALAEQMPDVRFIDYLHNEAYDGWKSGGYPTYSIISQRYLARTITCSAYLRRWAIERGHTGDRIGVVKLGIELDDFTPTTPVARAGAKATLLGVTADTIVITVVARLDPQKRSTLVPLIADELKHLGADNFLIIMLGGGPLEAEVTRLVRTLNVVDEVQLLGTITTPALYLAATDIFLLPSVSEGISVATSEAMAMGLPVVTARAGALPEQLGDDSDPADAEAMLGKDKSALAGILVNHTMIDSIDARLYAHELSSLIRSPGLRAAYGRNGLKLIAGMNWRSTLGGMFDEVDKAKNLDMRDLEHLRTLPNPAAHIGAQTMGMQARAESDLGVHYNNYRSYWAKY